MNESSSSSLSTSSDKLWNVLCHLSPFIGLALIGPLVVYLVTKSDAGSTIPVHAKETLNFHISLMIYGVIGAILMVVIVGGLILFAVAIGGLILSIIGAIRASNGEVYRYPATLRLVK